ncbi:hypothetical protein HY249_02130 [Candidatus Azambacteria bacterium]|nr:hypothetical protein [Candidatus Azambacteria bacterium]
MLNQNRWFMLCKMVGIEDAKIPVAYAEISLNYSEPDRYYHTLDHHIRSILTEFDDVRHLALNHAAVEMAIWFHDVKKTEVESAIFAGQMMRSFGLNDSFQSYVARLVFATKHDRKLFDQDEQLIADLDLSGFGKSLEEFCADGEMIRKEYKNPDDFQEKRKRILFSFFHKKGFVYHTKYFKDRYEENAKANLKSLV